MYKKHLHLKVKFDRSSRVQEIFGAGKIIICSLFPDVQLNGKRKKKEKTCLIYSREISFVISLFGDTFVFFYSQLINVKSVKLTLYTCTGEDSSRWCDGERRVGAGPL